MMFTNNKTTSLQIVGYCVVVLVVLMALTIFSMDSKQVLSDRYLLINRSFLTRTNDIMLSLAFDDSYYLKETEIVELLASKNSMTLYSNRYILANQLTDYQIVADKIDDKLSAILAVQPNTILINRRVVEIKIINDMLAIQK